jgi:hypothetical protein
MLDPDIQAHYQEQIREQERLLVDERTLELARTRELLRRYLPAPPCAVLDVATAES